MRKEKINQDWVFYKGYLPSLRVLQMQGGTVDTVQLPHDAMILEERTPDTKNGGHTGYYPGGIYTYFKTIDVPEDWQEKTAVLEFEGVYQTAMVYVNGVLAKTNLYGYSNFYVHLDPYLKYGESNEIKVVADNASEENSRWYSGSGIYRDVNLYLGNRVHIPVDGVKITTIDAEEETAVLQIDTEIRSLSRKKERVKLTVDLLWEGEKICEDMISVTLFGEETVSAKQQLTVRKPRLWDCEHPHLYDCVIKVQQGEQLLDEVTEKVGIRRLQLDAVHGLCINGKQVKLRGTCVHHDNGVIGAASFESGERRKCRLLKEAGFNSIRSSHHPAGKALLDACDAEGILVMDEICDMWDTHKNHNDFALHFSSCYQEIAEAMVKKDYNHPCVILYSTGNEIPEMGTEHGAKINRTICNLLAKLDSTRYTTNGINGLNAAGAKMFPIMQELMPLLKKEEDRTSADSSGSNAINSYMRLMDGEAGEAFAKHPLITEAIAESSEAMDIIGLNYLTGRHVLETRLHPNKCVLGTETFPADIARLWKLVKEHPQILGDFTWTGYDYIGEAGCGIFYYDGKQNFGASYPDRLAYIGDLNLLGYRRPISYLREIVYGLRKNPYLAVERVDRYGKKHSKTPWMFKDNISSWTWPGYEGRPAVVDIYSAEEEVELFLNGKSCGRKPAGETCGFTATYEICYEPGELLAVSYRNGEETGRYAVETAGEEVELSVTADRSCIHADGEDLSFLTVRLVDSFGRENLWASKEVEIAVKGDGVLQGYGSADPQATSGYQDAVWKTFDGQVMAVVRAGYTKGIIRVTFRAEGCREQCIEISTI